MTVFLVMHVAAIFVCAILGMAVFLTNTQRVANQTFLLLSLMIVGWLIHLAVGFQTTSVTMAKYCIRAATVFGLFLTLGLNWLRLSILHKEKKLTAILLATPVWLALAVITGLICCTNLYVHDVTFPLARVDAMYPVPEPVFGVGMFLFALYFAISLLALIIMFIRDVRRLSGILRTELQFILLGGTLGLLYGFVPVVLGPLLWNSTQMIQAAPAGAIILNGIVAYGIATKRILEVALFLRRVLAYSLLIAYLVGLYLLISKLAGLFWQAFELPGLDVPNILAAVIISFSMAPMHGLLQRFASQLFISWESTDVALAIQKADAQLQSVTTLDDLLRRFHQIVCKAIGTDDIRILIPQGNQFVQAEPADTNPTTMALANDSPLVGELAARDALLVLDTAERVHATKLLAAVVKQMRQVNASVAVGVHGKDGLSAVLLLGPRFSGRIYSAVEQDMLLLLGHQLAVALENARLYTQVQDSKVYNETLLDYLINGVIAINAEGRITVFNREAQRVTGFSHEAMLNQPVACLPAALAHPLQRILQQGKRLLNREIQLPLNGELVTLRAGGAIFKGHTKKTLGALLVFSDITDFKKLGQQIRRSDRLASVGTLTAGMAHEIKNPLVVLKTFAQLLPERYHDEDFRQTFTNLLPHEVDRIDSIINQLLEFSRPAKPNLEQVSLQAVMTRSLKLVAEEIYKRKATVESHFRVPADIIMADKHQLQQALLNFLLNALDAMSEGGRLSVTTTAVQGRYSPSATADAVPRPYVRLDITDTGCGIASDALAHIFDPFFTTKSNGTGLGLPVAHGIIQEHDGMIDVESQLGRGTTFHIFFPLLVKPVIENPTSA